MQRASEDLVGGAGFDDLSRVHHRDPIGYAGDDAEVETVFNSIQRAVAGTK